jgi:hypothetical protein
MLDDSPDRLGARYFCIAKAGFGHFVQVPTNPQGMHKKWITIADTSINKVNTECKY